MVWRLLVLLAATGILRAQEGVFPLPDWSPTVREVMETTVRSDDGSLTLAVKLEKLPKNEVEELKNDKGYTTGFRHKGRLLPERYWPGNAFLTTFRFTWDGKGIDIPARLWNDLPGLRLMVSTLDPLKVSSQLEWKAREFIQTLEQPRLSVSADGRSALIEWKRPEDCDGRSSIRWIITRDGTVVRHIDLEPCGC